MKTPGGFTFGSRRPPRPPEFAMGGTQRLRQVIGSRWCFSPVRGNANINHSSNDEDTEHCRQSQRDIIYLNDICVFRKIGVYDDILSGGSWE